MIASTRCLRVWMWAVTGALLIVLTGCGPSAVDRASTSAQPSADAVDNIAVIDSGGIAAASAFQDNQWQLMLQNTQADTEQGEGLHALDNTAIEVADDAQIQIPDSEVYAFVAAEPGDEVYELQPRQLHPTAEEAAAPSVGLSAESPETLNSVDRGVTFSLTGFEGPGAAATYTQPGFFGDPEPMWDSRQSFPQPHVVEVGSHVPVGWIFTEPGFYLVQLTAHGELLDGSEFSDTQILRFAVGSDIEAEEILSMAWSGPSPEQYFEHGAAANVQQQGTDTTGWLLYAALGIFAIVLLIAVLQLLRRLRRLQSQPGHNSPDSNTGDTR